jgi:glutaredoxin-related protein
MARVKIEKVIDHLDSEMRRALSAAVKQVIDDADFNDYDLFRAFKREVSRKFNTWETVPDLYVEK